MALVPLFYVGLDSDGWFLSVGFFHAFDAVVLVCDEIDIFLYGHGAEGGDDFL